MDRKKIIIGIALLTLVFLALEFVNGRSDFWDFRVYYGAATEWLSGNSPYGKSYGLSSGFYKYSPITVLFFIPLAILPYTVASVLFYMLNVFILIKLILGVHDFLSRFIIPKSKMVYWPLLIVILVVSAHLIRELHLGNINLILLYIFFIAFKNIENKKYLLSGLLIAIGLFFKPHFIVLIPLLVLKGNWKTLVGVILSAALLILLPIVTLGINGNTVRINEWFETMTSHNHNLLESPSTIYGLINHHVLIPLQIEGSNQLVIIVLGIVAALIFVLVVYNKMKQIQPYTSLTNFLEYFVIIALIPNLTHTDTEHFLWSLPLLMLLVYLIMSIGNRMKARIWIFVLLVSTFAWYLNSPDLLPMETVEFITKGGFLGLGNLVIIGLAIYFYFTEKDYLYSK